MNGLKIFSLLLIINFLANSGLHAQQIPVTGKATYYGKKFAGRKTASGEIFHIDSFTAAHRSLPFGTLLKVTCVRTGKAVIVKVNDRGPASKRFVIDVSYAAATQLDMLTKGVIVVNVEMAPPGATPGPLPDDIPGPDEAAPAKADDAKADKKKGAGYAVQLGAYTARSYADKAKHKFEAAGQGAVFVKERRRNGKTMYLLMVGPWKSQAEAREKLPALKEQSPGAFVVKL